MEYIHKAGGTLGCDYKQLTKHLLGEAFFDVHDFSPLANNNRGPLFQVYQKQEVQKWRKYGNLFAMWKSLTLL